jgi:hypothetical protein
MKEASDSFGGIFDKRHIALRAKRSQSINLGRMTKNVNNQDRRNAPPTRSMAEAAARTFALIGKEIAQAIGVQSKVARADIDEQRSRAAVSDAVRGRHEADGGADYEVVRPNAQRMERDMQAYGAVRRRNNMANPEFAGKFELETIDEGSRGGDPSRVETFLDVDPFFSAKLRLVQRDAPFAPEPPAVQLLQLADQVVRGARGLIIPQGS